MANKNAVGPVDELLADVIKPFLGEDRVAGLLSKKAFNSRIACKLPVAWGHEQAAAFMVMIQALMSHPVFAMLIISYRSCWTLTQALWQQGACLRNRWKVEKRRWATLANDF